MNMISQNCVHYRPIKWSWSCQLLIKAKDQQKIKSEPLVVSADKLSDCQGNDNIFENHINSSQCFFSALTTQFE